MVSVGNHRLSGSQKEEHVPVTIKDLESHKLTIGKILAHFGNMAKRIDAQIVKLKAEKKPTAPKK